MNGSAAGGNRRHVEIDGQLTARCEGGGEVNITADGTKITIDVDRNAIDRLDSFGSRRTFRNLRMAVAETRQTVEIGIGGTPAIRLTPQVTASGQTIAKLKVLRLTALIRLALDRLRRR